MKQTIRPSTFESYSQIVENHLIPGLGEVPLSKLTPQKVTAFLTDRHENGTRSAEHLRRVLRNALGFAMRHELIFRNVASLASCPKKAPKPPKFLTVDEAKRFLSACKGHRLEALFTVALACGLRFSEALGLSWEDVDLDARTLTVRKQLGRRGKGFSAPKSKSALRTVPIPGFAVEALKDHRLRQELQHRPLAGSRWKETGLVFTSTIGTPCEERNVRRDLYRILRENELPAIRFHDLRHSCATLLLAQGVDPRTIMQILGHSQITLTLQTYSHVLPTLTQDAADKMNSLLADG
jgi:integrase